MNNRRQQFIEYVKGGGQLLPKDVWRANTNLYKLWESRVDENDIRWKLCDGNVERFIDIVYDYLDKHLDTFLGAVYDSAFAPKAFRNIDNITVIDDSTIANTANNPGYFRNICFEEIVVCGGDADRGLSIKDAIVNTLNGRIRKTFTMPALFQDVHDGLVSSNMVLTFNKSCKLVSIFSPNVYRYLLRRLRSRSARCDSILFSTASWCVPVMAAHDLDYTVVDILDVQGTVLDKCRTVLDDIESKRNPLFDPPPFNMTTYCSPSEVMDTVIGRKYDHIISCPPYYDLEMYGASDQQSTDLYGTYEDWLENYWRKTVRASINLLEDGGVFSFVMGHHVRYHYMSKDMVEIATQEGLQLIDEVRIVPKAKTEKLYLSPVEKYEICSIFVKASNETN